MLNGWTAERRARQAQAIHGWQPWQWSTGPKSDEGERRSSLTAFRGAERPRFRELVKALNAMLRE